MPEIDVVIPTRNRHPKLARCLESLTRQTFDDFGVIVVDDESDSPVEPALPADLWDRLALRMFRNERRGWPAKARNVGVSQSSATYIAFLDDDVIADEPLLERHLEALAGTDRAYSFGMMREPAQWDPPNPWNHWAVRKQEVEYDRMRRGDYKPSWRQFFTANAFLRRDSLIEIAGFDERFTRSEDIELALRLSLRGYEPIFQPEAVIWHHPEHSQETWLDAVRQYARFDVAIDRLNPEIHRLEKVRRELDRRNRMLQGAGWALRLTPFRRVAAPALLWAARAIYHSGLRQPSTPLVSLAFDTEYRRSLDRSTGERSLERVFAGT